MHSRAWLVTLSWVVASCTMPNPAFEDGADEQGEGTQGEVSGESVTSEESASGSASTSEGESTASGEATASESTGSGESTASGESTSGESTASSESTGGETGSGCGELSECFGECTDTLFDDLNCGGCGVVCDPGSFCLDGTCTAADIKRAFVTSQGHTGAFTNGLVGADAFCNQAAEAAGLSGFYLAWLSNAGNSPAGVYLPGNAYVLLDGTQIAGSLAQLLDGNLDAAIDINEHGQPQPLVNVPNCPNVSAPVWSNTSVFGNLSMGPSCGEWTSGDPAMTGLVGDMNATDMSWTSANCAVPCNKLLPIYCIEP